MHTSGTYAVEGGRLHTEECSKHGKGKDYISIQQLMQIRLACGRTEPIVELKGSKLHIIGGLVCIRPILSWPGAACTFCFLGAISGDLR